MDSDGDTTCASTSQSIHFSISLNTNPQTIPVTIKNTGNEELEIHGITLIDDSSIHDLFCGSSVTFSLLGNTEATLEAGEETQFYIEGFGSNENFCGIQDEFNSITIHTNATEMPNYTIRLGGSYIGLSEIRKRVVCAGDYSQFWG